MRPGRSNQQWTWLLGGVLLLGCLWIYQGITAFGFVGLDDDYNVIFNPHLGPLTWKRVAWALTDFEYSRRYQPLGWLGLAAVFGFSGLTAGGYHVAAIVLHGANSLLAFAILHRFADRVLGATASRWRIIAAFAGAAFWAWHPLRVESVAWTSGLLYEQCTLFLFAALWWHLGPDTTWRRVMALGCYVLALLTYPVALGFGPLFVLIDARERGWRAALVRNGGYLIAAGALLGVTMLARVYVGGVWPAAPNLTVFPLWQRALQALYVWAHYLWRPWWPLGFTPVYPVLLDLAHPSWLVLGGAGLLLAVVAGVFGSRRTPTGWRWFLCAYLMVLVPVLGLVEKPHFPSDRYAFIPQLVWSGALVVALSSMSVRRSLAAVVGAGVLAVMAVASQRQTAIWADEITLWRHIESRLTVRNLPVLACARPALSLLRGGDTAGALALLDAGLRELPGDAMLADVRAEVLRVDADNRQRAQGMGLAESPPPAAVLHHSLAVQLARSGDAAAAAYHLVEVRRLAPAYYETLIRRGQPPSAR